MEKRQEKLREEKEKEVFESCESMLIQIQDEKVDQKEAVKKTEKVMLK